MSLILTNKATDKQKAFLVELGYVGTGKYVIDNLTAKEAAELIDELISQQDQDINDWY